MISPNAKPFQWECRHHHLPGDWTIVEAMTAEEAASRYIMDIEYRTRRVDVGVGATTALVVVRSLDNVLVQGCYRVSGRIGYEARIVEPGALTAKA